MEVTEVFSSAVDMLFKEEEKAVRVRFPGGIYKDTGMGVREVDLSAGRK